MSKPGSLPAAAPFDADSALASRVVPAVNVEARRGGLRPRLLILHYTGMRSAEKAVHWLACAESRVSCHYVIDEGGGVTQLVPEALRAWHAGVAHWRSESDINSASIGIEIQNPGHELGYSDFPAAQMEAVAALGRDIVRRHGMSPWDVLAHSDVAPSRKIDPGEKFDWRFLHERGVGHWVEPAAIDASEAGLAAGAAGREVLEVQTALRSYGYGIKPTGVLDPETWFALRAFQLHFRPSRVDGALDTSTRMTLERVLAALPAV